MRLSLAAESASFSAAEKIENIVALSSRLFHSIAAPASPAATHRFRQ
jgi:hypothetical protein